MVTIDLTKEAVTTSGYHFYLAYTLQKAKEDHVSLYKEIKEFDPSEEYSQYPQEVALYKST